MPSLIGTDANAGHPAWETRTVSPLIQLAYDIHDTLSFRTSWTHVKSCYQSQPSSSSHILDLFEYPAEKERHASGTECVSVSTNSWELSFPRIIGPFPPPTTKILNIYTVMGYGPFRSGPIMVGETAGDGVYVLKFKSAGTMQWIKLDIGQYLDPSTRNVGYHIWRFDFSLGRLFIHSNDALHVIYY